jgi:all-trans-retinol 13,14-reductase
MKKFDVVIIGSGLGGLVCGYILSKSGYRVGIFEKHHKFGGCLQTFSRNGVTFDTGMHYIGSMGKDQIMHRIFNYLNLLNNVPLHKLNEDAFEIISIEGRKYKHAMGFENFAETLAQEFPKEKDNINKYVKGIRSVSHSSSIYAHDDFSFSGNFINSDFVNISAYDYIRSITDNIELQDVLAGNNMLYAGVKEKTPLYIHALINNFYIQSAWRIEGGSDIIADSLCNSIRKFGGEVFSNAPVAKINCNTTKAVSIKLANGETIESKYFISNIHPDLTMQLIESPLIRNIYRERISKLENTISTFILYLTFKPQTVPYLNYNFYHYETTDVWDCVNYTPDNWPRNYLIMHQACKNSYTYANSAIVITYMNYQDVIKWENTTIGKRGDDYKRFKEEKTKRILSELEKSFPGISENIQSYYTSSPLTYRDYTATKHGSLYGILRNKNCPERTILSHRTKIPNLFLTGQNINAHGILGVSIGAILTSSEIVGMENILKEINS